MTREATVKPQRVSAINHYPKDIDILSARSHKASGTESSTSIWSARSRERGLNHGVSWREEVPFDVVTHGSGDGVRVEQEGAALSNGDLVNCA